MSEAKYSEYRGEGVLPISTWPSKVLKYFSHLHSKGGYCMAKSPEYRFYCTRSPHKTGPHVASDNSVYAVWDEK